MFAPLTSIAQGVILNNPKVVPSLVPIYKTTLTTTTDETTTTFSAVDIGTPHPNRVIVLAAYQGVGLALPTVTVNGLSFCEITGPTTAHEFKVMSFKVPDGETATISYGATGSLRKAISVYVVYCWQPLSLARAALTANTTTDATTSNVRCQAGGCAIYAGGQHATLGTFTTTATTTTGGTATVTENVDAQLEAAASYTMGNITFTNASTFNITMAESTSGTKRLHMLVFSPPYSGAYPTTV